MEFLSQHPRIAELQGLYGPLQILECKVQQLWALQQLQGTEWTTRGGTRLRVRSPGRWNRGAGPDFQEAVIELDGHPRVGDVEIHLYREDWWRHGHDSDPAYNQVMLHVVLFAGGMDRPVRSAAGRVPEEWVMGPWLREDLESVSGGEPGLFGELVPELREWMESDHADHIRGRLRAGADRRWQDKESMARCLYDPSGWQGALHRMTLYYMGFPYNRRAFFRLAEVYPISCWRDTALMEVIKDGWADEIRWGAGRPANRAAARLQEYLRLNALVPDWTERLRDPPRDLIQSLHPENTRFLLDGEAGGIRRRGYFKRWRSWLYDRVLGSVPGAALADRLWVDSFLPMLVVDGQVERQAAAGLWFHGRAGAYPDPYRDLLKLAGVQSDPRFPLCNGWIQGVLWLEDQLRLERLRSCHGPCTASAARSGA
jgi:hypothetical protein